jgi:pyruvate formate lyase activating enzyme
VNDDEECLKYVIKNHLKYLGEEVPMHFTRYHPAYKFHNLPTKIEVLERAYEMAKKNGIQYPYLGNVLRHKYENTYCPNCGELLIKRYGHRLVKNRIKKDNKCGKCGYEIPIRSRYTG